MIRTSTDNPYLGDSTNAEVGVASTIIISLRGESTRLQYSVHLDYDRNECTHLAALHVASTLAYRSYVFVRRYGGLMRCSPSVLLFVAL